MAYWGYDRVGRTSKAGRFAERSSTDLDAQRGGRHWGTHTRLDGSGILRGETSFTAYREALGEHTNNQHISISKRGKSAKVPRANVIGGPENLAKRPALHHKALADGARGRSPATTTSSPA